MIKNKIILVSLLTITFTYSCKKDLDEKPVGSGQAIPVYNHAYQENYANDKIEEIIQNAVNAYVLIDPYEDNSNTQISAIKANGNQVGGYISIGTAEDWRSDFNSLKQFAVTKQWGEWAGEYFIDNAGAIDIMKARIDQLADWGCDWVEFDNMDWAFDDVTRKKYGFTITPTEAISYYNELCDYVHAKGMKCMGKNTVKDGPGFDGALYESFNNNYDWWDHAEAQALLNAGKLVIINHYNEKQPNKAYQKYIDLYDDNISFICESKKAKKYIHFNE